MDPRERAIRELYDARARGDLESVGALLADDVGWHEPGSEDYSGEYRGREAVLDLLAKLDQVTDRFELRPEGVLCAAEHAAALIRWSAARGSRTVEGNEIAVFRFADGMIAEVWFWPDGFDPEALTAVFAYN